MDSRHDDDVNDPRRLRAFEVAADALSRAPEHRDHKHGVIVGYAVDPAGDDPAIIAVVQGVDVPCWIMLDDDDMERIAYLIARRIVVQDPDLELPN